jgi:cytochrome c oxidase subunit 2
VFVIVEGALLYSIFRFRAKKGAVAAQIHGNTRLEIGWTVAAALILVALTVVTFIHLPAIINPPDSSANGLVLSASVTRPTPPNGKSITICVQGRQYIWRYTYGDGCLNAAFSGKLPYSYQTMYAPADTTVILDIQSTDVVHSWWVPSLGGKVDAVPGYTTYTWFKAPGASVPRPVRAAMWPQPRGDDRVREDPQPVGLQDQARAAVRRHQPGQRSGHAATPDPHRQREPWRLTSRCPSQPRPPRSR